MEFAFCVLFMVFLTVKT